MAYYGDIATSAILDFKFTTKSATTGAPTTLSGGAVKVYKDNSTTESTAGITLSADFDSVTGLNNVRIDTSADGTFYSAGSNFTAVLTAGTVGGTTAVGYTLGDFSIFNRTPLRPTTDGRTLDVTAGGEAGIDWANIGAPTTTNNLSGTTISAVSGAVGSVTGAVGSVTGAVGSVTGNVGGNVNGNVVGTVASVVTKTGYELSSTGNDAVADATLTRANGVETGYTLQEALRLILSSVAGKLSGAATTTVTIRNVPDTKNRIVATVDSDGNRTAVTYDVT